MTNVMQAARRRNVVVVDKTIPSHFAEKIRSGEILMADGVPLPLSKTDTRKRVYSKFESPSPEISDTQHSDTWTEEFTASSKVFLMGEDDEGHPAGEDDGVILKFSGEPVEEVCIDLNTNRVIDLVTAELEEEATGVTYPRYMRWDFYLTSAILTDGPEARAELHEVAEKQRAKAEAVTNDKLGKILDKIVEKLGTIGGDPNSIDPDVDPLDRLMQEMSPAQIKAAIEMRVDAKEEAEKAAEESVEEPVTEEQTTKRRGRK